MKHLVRTSLWSLEKTKEGVRIRRYQYFSDQTKKSENHPQNLYKHLIDNDKELKAYVVRLNGNDPRALAVEARLNFEHSFITPEMLDEYQTVYLRNAIPSEAQIKTLMFYLQNYALNYFVNKLHLANPIEWKANESLWGLALLQKQNLTSPKVFEDNDLRSIKVLKMIVYELNRFMKYVHSKRIDIPPLEFNPLTRASIKQYQAELKLNNKIKETKYIPLEHWKIIELALEGKPWGAVVKLSYYFGLRKKEAYGLELSNVKKGYLNLRQQINNYSPTRTFKPLKSRVERKCPYWFAQPLQAHSWIRQLDQINLHPDTISDLFIKLCADLKLPKYNLHDLRRSFITNAVQTSIPQEELRLAIGHVDSATTFKYYVKDARKMDDDLFVPGDVG